MQCPLDINTIMRVWMNICGSFCLKTNLSWVAPMSVFGYKTIHNFHCLWYNNSIWYTVCQYMSMSWFLIVQGRQQWTLFLCTVWDSLIHHIALMSLLRTGLSREGEINETKGVGAQAIHHIHMEALFLWSHVQAGRQAQMLLSKRNN